MTETKQAEANTIDVTLQTLCAELKVKPRDARMLLRLAVKKKAEFPTLAKDHVPRQPWSWAPNSKGLAEARKALTSTELTA